MSQITSINTSIPYFIQSHFGHIDFFVYQSNIRSFYVNEHKILKNQSF